MNILQNDLGILTRCNEVVVKRHVTGKVYKATSTVAALNKCNNKLYNTTGKHSQCDRHVVGLSGLGMLLAVIDCQYTAQ